MIILESGGSDAVLDSRLFENVPHDHGYVDLKKKLTRSALKPL